MLAPRLHALLDALQGEAPGKLGRIRPADILVATKAPDGAEAGLARLLRSLDDPILADIVKARLAASDVGREERIALPRILALAEARHGSRCRLSTLATSEAVEKLLQDALGRSDDGRTAQRSPNSVIRYERTALSHLLTAQLGRAERNRIFASVRFESADDRRRLRPNVVTPEALAKLCAELQAGCRKEGDGAAPLYARIAMTTGAEVPAIARARVRDLVLSGPTTTLWLRDTKKANKGASRDRDVTLPAVLAAEVARYAFLADGTPRPPDAPLFPLASSRFQTMWGKARLRAGLAEAVLDGQNQPTPLRPHDLRRVYAHFGRAAGVSRETIGLARLGHSRLEQTDTYIRADVRVTTTEADAIAAELGLGREPT